jgi:hypothetical protein
LIQKINAYKILVGQSEDETLLRRARGKWADVSEVDTEDFERESLGWSHVTLNTVVGFVYAVMTVHVA